MHPQPCDYGYPLAELIQRHSGAIRRNAIPAANQFAVTGLVAEVCLVNLVYLVDSVCLVYFVHSVESGSTKQAKQTK